MEFPVLLKRRLLLCYLGLILVGGLSAWLYLYYSPNLSQAKTDSTPPEAAVLDSNPKTIPQAPEDIDAHLATSSAQVSAQSKHLGFLLLGYGGAGHDGGYLSDTIILAYLDVTKKKLALIHIPRDIWVTVAVGPTSIPMKINGALAMGTKTSNYPTTTLSSDTILRASSLTKQAVTTITGLPIDFVVGVDFNGFSQAINALSGVEVSVPAPFEDQWYPVKGRELELCGHAPEAVTAMSATMSGFRLEQQFPCRYEHLKFKAGSNHMDGDTALKYGRSRHSSSDFARGMRQIAIVQAVGKKLFSLEALKEIPRFYRILTKAIKTDISVDQITTITPILTTIPNLQVVEIGLDTTNVLKNGTARTGAFILLPKDGEDQWQATQSYIKGKL